MIKSALRRSEYIDRQIELRERRRRIEFIERVLPKNGIGAELGVFKGHFSGILLKHTKARKLHLIDPWYFLTAHWLWARGNQSTVDALLKVLRTFKKEIEDGRILVHVGDDVQILATFPEQYLDWVYIDSSHTYEQTKDELQILTSKVKNNGIIAGDDWQPEPSHMHHGVYKAVNEFIGSEEYRLIYSDRDNRQWAIKKKLTRRRDQSVNGQSAVINCQDLSAATAWRVLFLHRSTWFVSYRRLKAKFVVASGSTRALLCQGTRFLLLDAYQYWASVSVIALWRLACAGVRSL